MKIDLAKVEKDFRASLNNEDNYKPRVSKLAFLQVMHSSYLREHDKFINKEIDLSMKEGLELCCKLIVVSQMVSDEIENPTEK